MPYFKWRGVDLQGRDRKGLACAQSAGELDEQLLQQDIALIKHKQMALPFWKTIGRSTNTLPLVQQLAFLLHAGVLLPKALRVVAQQAPLNMQEVMGCVTHEVSHGVPLYQALEKHQIFDHIVIIMARVGTESGSLATALQAAADYLEMEQAVAKKLRSAAMVPALTAGMFVLIVGVIFTVMVPRFADLYQSAHQELPALTQMIVKMSNACCSVSMIWLLAAGLFLWAMVAAYFRTQAGKNRYDFLLLNLPLLGAVYKWRTLAYFFGAASLLNRGGMPLTQALVLAQQTIDNDIISKQLATAIKEVELGTPLSKALAHHENLSVREDVTALIRVGEESGQLAIMMNKAACIYQEAVDARLTTMTTLFQPLLVMVLGILIVVVIVAAYLPIFNLSNIF